MYTLPRRPGSIGQVLDAAVMLFKASFKAVLPFSIVAAVLALAPIIVQLLGVSANRVEPTVANLEQSRSPLYWGVVGISICVSLINYAALMVRAESIARGAKVTNGAALAIARRRSFILLLVVVCFLIVLALGLILLVIPGLILLISMSMYSMAIVLDGKGIESLGYSHSLVWGNWWRTSALLTVGGIVVYVMFLMVDLVVVLVAQVLALDPVTQFMILFLSNAFVTLLTTPFLNALMLEIYRDLKLRKEGGDLDERLTALGPATV
ncbi:MAG: hypothetical protein ACRET4_03945 [Steroidobacteraceae bacterium]